MGVSVDVAVDSRSTLGEGPVWDVADQCLWWVDIKGHLVHRYDPVTGVDDAYDVGEPVGCLAVRAAGGLIIATKTGFYTFDPGTGAKVAIHDPEAHLEGNRFNDGTTDRQGRFWAGTMRDDGTAEKRGTFYRMDADLSVTPMLDGFFTTNGSAFSPDGTVMYLSDSNADVQTIWAFDYDIDDGAISNRRVFFDARAVAGRPDGGTVDADGCYWMAGISGWQVVRITPGGVVDRIVEVPIERPTKPMFGGAGLDVMFVTSLSLGLTPGSHQPHAGSLHAITGLGVTGVPEVRFKG